MISKEYPTDLAAYRKFFHKPEPSYIFLPKSSKKLRRRNKSPASYVPSTHKKGKAKAHASRKKCKRFLPSGTYESKLDFDSPVLDSFSEVESHPVDKMTVIVFHAQYTIKMCLPSHTSVQQLQLKLYTLTDIPPRNQRLFYQNTLITSAHNLADFKCDIMSLALVKGPVFGGGKETECQFSPEALTKWLCRNYQETDKSWYISKDNLFREAIDYFKVSETTSNKRHFFEILGCHIFGKIPEFMTINLKSKKQIRGLQKRGVPQTSDSTAAQSASNRSMEEMVSEDYEELMIDTEKEQTGGNIQHKATEIKHEMNDSSRENEKERNVNEETVSEDIEGVMIDTEKEQTGGNIEQNVTEIKYDSREDEKESNVNDGTVRESVMIDTEKEQTAGNIEQNATEMIYEMKNGRRGDEKESNVNDGKVNADIEDVMTDTEKEKTGGNIVKDGSREGENKRNINDGTVSEDIEGVTVDTEKEQTCGNIEENATEIKYEMNDHGSREDGKESYDDNQMVSEGIEGVMIDIEKEQTWWDMNAMKVKCDGRDSDDTDETVTLKHPCIIASAEDMFCNKVLLSSRQWNNANVKDLKPQELDCQNFKQYLSFSVPKPLPRVNSEERMLIYQSSGYSTSHPNNCLRAFLIKAFPPVQVCNAASRDFSSLTFPGDILPQFTGTCHSSVRNRTRFSIQCVVCPLYQDRCTRQGVFSKLSSCGGKDLDGISQAMIHHKLCLHQSALAYFSGCSATVTPVESSINRDVQQTHQRTIFQALKVNEPNTKVTHCLGFFENQEIVESYKDSSGIRRVTAKTLFKRERSTHMGDRGFSAAHHDMVSNIEVAKNFLFFTTPFYEKPCLQAALEPPIPHVCRRYL